MHKRDFYLLVLCLVGLVSCGFSDCLTVPDVVNLTKLRHF